MTSRKQAGRAQAERGAAAEEGGAAAVAVAVVAAACRILSLRGLGLGCYTCIVKGTCKPAQRLYTAVATPVVPP